MKRSFVLLFFIIILACFLRLYQLGAIPAALEWDEVAIGYDAYSILKTGRDQFGEFFPLSFRSLDDWKPPIYEYLAIIPIALLGLTEFATRLPSAMAGIIAVFLTFPLGVIIFSHIPSTRKHAISIGLVSALLLAVSPWHLQFSRAAFEVNVSVAITIAAAVSFLLGLKRSGFFFFSAVLFGLDLFSYHSTRVVGPLLLIGLFTLFARKLPAKSSILVFFLIFGVFFAGFIPIATSPNAQIRFRATNIFNPGARFLDEKDLPKEFLDRRLQDAAIGYEIDGKIFHNQRLIFLDYDILKKAFFNYISHFGFEYLFVKGDAPLHHAPGFGLLHIVEFPFLVIGTIYLLLCGKSRWALIIPLWMFAGPVPVAVTRGAPHAVRSELMLPMFQLVTAVGLVQTALWLRREATWVWGMGMLVLVSIFALNHAFYLHQYYVHTDYELSRNWIYGRKEAVAATEGLKHDYDRVIVAIRADMPHVFWLFYSGYPPERYLAEGGTVSGGFAEESNAFDKYEFRNFDYDTLPTDERLLLVSVPEDFPPDAQVIQTIYYKNGEKALIIAQNRWE